MKSNMVIKVEYLSKTFLLPHEKYSTAKQRFVNIFGTKKYERFKALDDISFEVKKGEFFGIIGSNGSGKSTLLKILAQIYQPTSGKVEISGKVSPFIELGVGFNPELTARENVFLNASILGLSKKETEEKFNDIIAFAELENFVDQKLKNFSSGMQVRLAFSIAIQAEAEVLLVDEVLAVGDIQFQQKCFDVFRDLKKSGKTVIFVSHALNVIEDFCDRTLWLDKGKIKAIGDTKVVLQKYQSFNLEGRTGKIKDKSKSVGKRFGSGELILRSVDIFDENGQKVKLLNSGKDYSIVFKYDVKKKPTKFNLGFGVYSLRGDYCFSVNTKLDRRNVKAVGELKLKIKRLALNTGEYYYNVVLFGENETQPYDWVGEFGRFVVNATARQRGVLVVDHLWLDS